MHWNGKTFGSTMIFMNIIVIYSLEKEIQMLKLNMRNSWCRRVETIFYNKAIVREIGVNVFVNSIWISVKYL